MKTLLRSLFLLLVLAIACLALGAIWLRNTGLSARHAPGPFETAAARRARRFAIPRSAKELRNPLQPTPEAWTEGRKHFADHCAVCHANDGSGNAELGRNLYPQAPDMRLPDTQNLTDGELYYIIQNGVRFTGMPAWGEAGPHDHQSWSLVLFIRHLPKLTPEELKDMEHYNPKSEADRREEREEEEFLNAPPEPAGSARPRKGEKR
jgi:mono/diheme cytochrome c family protein